MTRENFWYREFRTIVRLALAPALIFLSIFLLPPPYVREIVIFAIYVMSFDLLYGYLKMVSFGHPLYLGTGAYATALYISYVDPNPALGLLVGIGSGVLIGALLGPLLVKLRGDYFALVNLAFCAAGYFLIYQPLKDITGGMDGIWYMTKMATTPILNLRSTFDLFIFSLLVLLLILRVRVHIATSSFGVAMKAIKDNEVRIRFLGYRIENIKYIAFIFSTTLAALAGSLYAVYFGFISPSIMEPIRAGEVIFASLLGGAGSFYGPIVGSAIYIGLKDVISRYVIRWEALVGIAILVIMFRFPSGVWGYIEAYLRRAGLLKTEY